VIFERFFDDMLAQASFLIACPVVGEAIVIDPTTNLDRYLDFVERNGLKISHVTETHIHADFVSGSRELAIRTGAQLHVSDEGPAEWKYAFADSARLLKDGDTIQIGKIVVRAIHTPGHTPEHLTFGLETSDGETLGLFTGDFVFVGDLGRPDLLETAAGMANTMEASAKVLYQSVQKLAKYDDSILIWPGHGAGSACGKSLGGTPETTLGQERKHNWGLQPQTEKAFVAEALANQPEPPGYFAEMKRVNKLGLTAEDYASPFRRFAGSVLKDLVAQNFQVIDVRQRSAVLNQYLHRSLTIPLGRSFTNWAGSLVEFGRPIIVLSDSVLNADAAVAALQSIGFKDIRGYSLSGSVPQSDWQAFPQVQSQDVPNDMSIVDVRTGSERAEMHVPGSKHLPIFRLLSSTVEQMQPCAVHCGSGARAFAATSFLISKGVPAQALIESFATVHENTIAKRAA
jgi:hydroxyacylglutathione hydrolase